MNSCQNWSAPDAAPIGTAAQVAPGPVTAVVSESGTAEAPRGCAPGRDALPHPAARIGQRQGRGRAPGRFHEAPSSRVAASASSAANEDLVAAVPGPGSKFSSSRRCPAWSITKATSLCASIAPPGAVSEATP